MAIMSSLLANIFQKQRAELPILLGRASVPREAQPRLLAALKSPQIKAILGPRRAGKSSLALTALQGHRYAYFNFEDEDLRSIPSAEEILAACDTVYPNYEFLFFDEIQIFPHWEKLLNRLERLGKNIIVTGSNSKLLSDDIGATLTGRHTIFELFPFSFAEFLTARPQERSATSYLQYLQSGGFPAVALGRTSPRDFLTTLWDSILLKDIAARHKIRRLNELRSLLYLALMHAGSRVTLRSLERELNQQLNHSTINKFIDYGQAAYLCCMLTAYSYKPRVRVNAEKKLYTFDNGFYTAHQVTPQADYGKLLENNFFIELCRRGYKPNLDFFYWQGQNQNEVDFLLLKNGRPDALYQICATLDRPSTEHREVRALFSAGRELGVTDLNILTLMGNVGTLQENDQVARVIQIWQGESN